MELLGGGGMGSNCILGLTAPQEKTEHSRTHKHTHTRDRRVGGWVGGRAPGPSGPC